MKTITVQGFIIAKQETWNESLNFNFSTVEMGNYGYITVQPHTLTFELPDTFNMSAEQIKALEKQRDDAFNAYSETVQRINAQISKLQAIEYDASSDNPANYPAEVPA